MLYMNSKAEGLKHNTQLAYNNQQLYKIIASHLNSWKYTYKYKSHYKKKKKKNLLNLQLTRLLASFKLTIFKRLLKYLELQKPTNQSRAGIKAILIHQHQTRQTEVNMDIKIDF